MLFYGIMLYYGRMLYYGIMLYYDSMLYYGSRWYDWCSMTVCDIFTIVKHTGQVTIGGHANTHSCQAQPKPQLCWTAWLYFKIPPHPHPNFRMVHPKKAGSQPPNSFTIFIEFNFSYIIPW